MTGLESSPLYDLGSFNWVYLIEFITCGLLALFFLFYFNRLLATGLAWLVRLYLWHAYRVYIDIGALQISLLAGRVFFKGIRYHGDNETILIHAGYITWRYWLLRVQHAPLFAHAAETDVHEGTASEGSSHDAEEHPDGRKRKRTAEGWQGSNLPCRISVRVTGVEAFIYNRGPAYDWILDNIKKRTDANVAAKQQKDAAQQAEKETYHGIQRPSADEPKRKSSSLDESADPSSTSNTVKHDSDQPEDVLLNTASAPSLSLQASKPKVPAFLQILPVFVECQTAAAVLGSENTKSIITAKIDSASGVFSADKAGALDIFKIVMDFEIEKPIVKMLPNHDYKRPQLSEAVALKDLARKIEKRNTNNNGNDVDSDEDNDEDEKSTFSHPKPHLTSIPKQDLMAQVRDVFRLRRRRSAGSVAGPETVRATRDPIPNIRSDFAQTSKWTGLRRYLDEEAQDEHNEWETVEYAKASTIAELERVSFKFFWDIPGLVPDHQYHNASRDSRSPLDINIDAPPEYGMQLAVHGGTVHYGPWADRHRINLQEIFFPASYVDAVPLSALKPGDTRVNTVFTLRLTIEKETILRIPFREGSKDWKWKGRANNLGRQDAQGGKSKSSNARSAKRRDAAVTVSSRPFAWFDIHVGQDTSIGYTQDMFPMGKSFTNKLKVEGKDIQIYSSLNHALLWRSLRVGLDCDLSNPVAWNGLREWLFEITISQLDFFLLRDHTFLLMDLINDWTQGPPPDFYTFVPFRYLMKVKFDDFKLWLNVNESNIINSSDDLDDNDFVILYGKRLNSDLTIPLDRFRPNQNEIAFDAVGQNLGLELRMPPKNTLHTMLEDKNVTKLPRVTLNGSYTYWATVAPGLTETLAMRIVGTGLDLQLYGFFGRQLAKVKENYFGDDLHFKTLEEYQELTQGNPNPANADQPAVESNDLDVILDISAEDANILLPASLYCANEHVRLHVDCADIDLRVTNYYLELMVRSSPVVLTDRYRDNLDTQMPLKMSSSQIFIDGVEVVGHRLFGLGPVEPSYVSNWDVNAGSIYGDCCSNFLATLAAAGQAIAMTFPDHENALPLPHISPIPDVTFVRFACDEIRLWFPIADEVFSLSTRNIHGKFDDFAGRVFSQQLQMSVPEILVACASLDDSGRHRKSNQDEVQTQAYLRTSLDFSMVQRSKDFNLYKSLQQKHLAIHDTPTKRADFLVAADTTFDMEDVPKDARLDREVSMDAPLLPSPRSIADHLRSQSDHRDVALGSLHESSGYFDDPYSQSARTVLGYKSSAGVKGPSHLDAATHDTKSPGALPSNSLSSSYQLPTLPFARFNLDLSDVPSLSSSNNSNWKTSRSAELLYDVEQDDDAVHTSFVVSVTPGIVVYVKPQAIFAISTLLDRLSPRNPDALLDRFQLTTTSEVLAALSKKHGQNNIVDVSVKVPEVHFRLDNPFNEGSSDCDRFDLFLNRTSLFLRQKVLPERTEKEDSLSVHTSVDSVSLKAREHSPQRPDGTPALHLQIDKILLWLVDGEKTTIHTSFNMIESALASNQVDYVANLTYRTTRLAEEAESRFASIAKSHEQRMQYLVFAIVQNSQGVTDPTFLTVPSYVIRSAKDHIRNTDSWKIVSRIRHVWRQMPRQLRHETTAQLVQNNISADVNARTYVLTELDRWRSWDTINVKSSFAMRVLYGRMAQVEGIRDKAFIPVGVTLHGSGIKLLVDPGPKQSEASIKGIAVGVSITPPPPKTARKIFEDLAEVRSTVVQVNTSRLSVRLNWEICKLVDKTLSLFTSAPTPPPESNNAQRLQGFDDGESSEEQTFHIVVAAQSGTIQLDTINIIQMFSTEQLCFSIFGRQGSGQQNILDLNTLISADAAYVESIHKQVSILKQEVIAPSICVEYHESVSGKVPPRSLNVAGDAREITVHVIEEIQGLIEIANHVVDDEVSHLLELATRHDMSAKSPGPAENNPIGLDDFAINIALFLGEYDIRIALLHDLAYHTSGRVIRLAVTPDPLVQGSIRADFDLKAQIHSVRKRLQDSRQPESAAFISLPPINGTFSVLTRSSLVNISAMLSVEKVELDGSAIYHMYSLVSTSQMMSAVEAVTGDVKTLQESINDILGAKVDHSGHGAPETQVTTATDPVHSIIFDGNVTLAGLQIKAAVPKPEATGTGSEVMLSIGLVQLRSGNRSAEENIPLPFPELRLWLGELSLEMYRHKANRLEKAGMAQFGAIFTCDVTKETSSLYKRSFKMSVAGPQITITKETAPLAIEVLAYFQDRMSDLDFSKEKEYFQRLKRKEIFRRPSAQPNAAAINLDTIQEEGSSQIQYTSDFSFNLQRMDVCYAVDQPKTVSDEVSDLTLTLETINLKTRSESSAMLQILNLQLQLCPSGRDHFGRLPNSALLPEVKVIVTHKASPKDRKLRVLAAGKALDLQLDPDFVRPIHELERSLSASSRVTRKALRMLKSAPAATNESHQMPNLLGDRPISSVMVETSFAGAVIMMQNQPEDMERSLMRSRPHNIEQGRYGQFADEGKVTRATLRAPGIQAKAHYSDDGTRHSYLKVEVQVEPSSNTLSPSVVPLILRVANGVQQVIDESRTDESPHSAPATPTVVANTAKYLDEDAIIGADPRAILGRTKLTIGFRVCRQEFSLSCQPYAKVSASARLDDIYVMVNTVESSESGNFFSISATLSGLNTSLQHVYSRDATFRFDMESIVISMMNSKHLKGKNGISAIIRINPTKAQVNAKQIQDVLLFREIWLPPEIRNISYAATSGTVPEVDTQDYFVHRYHEVAASTSFNWNATVSVSKLDLVLDLGQAIGKTVFEINDLWASSKKTSSAQQTLCVGIEQVAATSSGRMSGFVILDKVKARTSIAWDDEKNDSFSRPLIQASIGFGQINVKAAFDYQAFAVLSVKSFEFIMYNARHKQSGKDDRLVAILDGDSVNLYCTSASAALAVALFQAFERLVQETQTSYDQSLKSVERFLHRQQSTSKTKDATTAKQVEPHTEDKTEVEKKSDEAPGRLPLTLHNDVVVTLRSIDIGAFPGSFFDAQLLRLKAIDLQARFAVAMEQGRIHSGLGLTLGQVSAALADIPRAIAPKKLGEITVQEVVQNALASRGGTILRVPKVVLSMQTWQQDESKAVDYTFKSSFEGKIDVGWNYSRISYIRGMWATHARSLASRLGKPLPESAVKISGAPKASVLVEAGDSIAAQKEGDAKGRSVENDSEANGQGKITAVVNLPQSRYSYRALEPPIIDTPQLRDMGEATPPLEWIGLHRDKLPNLTHQIVIVSLLGIAKEVEDAYVSILGSAH